MRSSETVGPAPAKPVMVITSPPGSDAVEVPDGPFLLTAEFARQGDDLLLQGPDQAVLVRDYFASTPASDLVTAEFARQGDDLLLQGPDQAVLVRDYFASTPDLVTESGARIHGEVAVRLAGPLAPAQVAQTAATDGGEPVGEVTELSGSASVVRTNGVEQQLSIGDPVFLGDVLRTGPDTSVGIRFVDDTLFSLSSNARLVIDQVIFNPEGADNTLSLSLLQGAFAFVSGQIAPSDGPGMTISTPVATIGVRGTTGAGEFLAAVQRLVVSLLEGLDGELGVIDVYNNVSLQSLTGVLDTLTVTSANETLPPPGTASDAQLAIYNLALSSLSRSYLDLIQDIAPEAGPEQEGGSGSSGAILAYFLQQAELQANFTAPDESGEVQEFQVEVDEERLGDLLAENPNLILLLQALAEIELQGLTVVVDLDGEPGPDDGAPTVGGPTGFATEFPEGGDPVPVVGNVAIVSVSGNVVSATIAIDQPFDAANESLELAGPLPEGITLDPSSTSSTLLLTGTAPTEAYQEALQLVRYVNTSDDPTDSTITVQVSDGVTNSNVAVTMIDGVPSVLAVGSNQEDQAGNDAAHLVPDPAGGGTGAILGSGADDVLIGDPGGARAIAINVVLVLDVSGSMAGFDRLETAKAALENLLDTFDQPGAEVQVQIIPFTLGVQNQGSFDISNGELQDAKDFINALVADGGTNYTNALDAVRAYLGNLEATPPGDLNEVYFISDGMPSEDPTQAIEDFLQFVEDYENPGGDIDPGAPLRVHAVAIGEDASLTQLNQIDTTDDGAQVVLDGEDLSAALESTVGLLPVGADSISGGNGDDVIFGDVINTDDLPSELFGGAGDHDGAGYEALVAFLTESALAGTEAGEAPTLDQIHDYIRENAESFIVEGDERGEADSIDGGGGNDTIFGMGGDDLLRGGEGDDSLTGGSGQDTFLFGLAEASGADTIVDFVTGADGDILRLEDVFDYNGDGLASVTDLESAQALADGWSVADNGSDVIITFGDNPDNGQNGGEVTLQGIGDGTITSFAALDAGLNLEVNA